MCINYLLINNYYYLLPLFFPYLISISPTHTQAQNFFSFKLIWCLKQNPLWVPSRTHKDLAAEVAGRLKWALEIGFPQGQLGSCQVCRGQKSEGCSNTDAAQDLNATGAIQGQRKQNLNARIKATDFVPENIIISWPCLLQEIEEKRKKKGNPRSHCCLEFSC